MPKHEGMYGSVPRCKVCNKVFFIQSYADEVEMWNQECSVDPLPSPSTCDCTGCQPVNVDPVINSNVG